MHSQTRCTGAKLCWAAQSIASLKHPVCHGLLLLGHITYQGHTAQGDWNLLVCARFRRVAAVPAPDRGVRDAQAPALRRRKRRAALLNAAVLVRSHRVGAAGPHAARNVPEGVQAADDPAPLSACTTTVRASSQSEVTPAWLDAQRQSPLEPLIPPHVILSMSPVNRRPQNLLQSTVQARLTSQTRAARSGCTTATRTRWR